MRKDGTRFWAPVVIDAVRDETGELIGFAKVTRDISERKEAEMALAQANEELMQQAKGISADLAKEGIEVAPEKEIVALIAYLQRLGTDVKVKE